MESAGKRIQIFQKVRQRSYMLEQDNRERNDEKGGKGEIFRTRCSPGSEWQMELVTWDMKEST
jgi:hypothetical protein